MKILHFNTLYAPNIVGGAEKSVQTLAESLRDLGCEQSVVCNGPHSSNDSVNHMNVIRIPSTGPYFPFDNKRRSIIAKLRWQFADGYLGRRSLLRSIIKSESPDIIHTHNFMGFGPALFKTILESNAKWVHTIRDYSLICPKTTMFAKGRTCGRPCIKCMAFRKFSYLPLFRPDIIVGISNFILGIHLKHIRQGVKQHMVIYNPVSSVLYDRDIDIKKSLKLRVGFIGRLETQKGIELFLSLMGQPELKDVHWTIAGRGTQAITDKLKLLDKNMTNFQFLGFIKADEFYSQIDVVCVPSLWDEPFGRIPIEAALYGVFPIVSDKGGLPEVINALNFGEVAKPTVNSFAKKIQNFKNSRTQLCKPNYNTFRSSNIAQQYYQTYERLCLEK